MLIKLDQASGDIPTSLVFGERADEIMSLSCAQAERPDRAGWHPVQCGAHLLLHEHKALGEPGVGLLVGVVPRSPVHDERDYGECDAPGTMKLRELTRTDWPQLLALNLASVRELSELDEQRLEWILSLTHRGLAVESGGEMVAFALAIAPGTPYDSQNYRWFGARFERFLYLDRIVVTAPFRRRGIGTQLYDAMEAVADRFERMACDVNILPPNRASLAFHTARGYREIGRLIHGQEKIVALLSKELQPHASG